MNRLKFVRWLDIDVRCPFLVTSIKLETFFSPFPFFPSQCLCGAGAAGVSGSEEAWNDFKAAMQYRAQLEVNESFACSGSVQVSSVAGSTTLSRATPKFCTHLK